MTEPMTKPGFLSSFTEQVRKLGTQNLDRDQYFNKLLSLVSTDPEKEITNLDIKFAEVFLAIWIDKLDPTDGCIDYFKEKGVDPTDIFKEAINARNEAYQEEEGAEESDLAS